jgi:ABC-type phosphonate transport system ATPase subunit
MNSNLTLWAKWTDLWYELHLADEIIAPGFKLCLDSEHDVSSINAAASVATVADRVLNQGQICDQGTTSGVLHAPTDPYTRRLLEAAPSISDVGSAWESTSSE